MVLMTAIYISHLCQLIKIFLLEVKKKRHSIFSPKCPEEMDWSKLFPDFLPTREQKEKHDDPAEESHQKHQVEFADIGCGYGGLLGMK